MAQRRSKNRRSSRLLTNYLDDNTDVVDGSNNPAWYQYSSVRPSTSINLTKRGSTILNSDSAINLSQQSDWFENLSQSDSFKRKLGAMDNPKTKSKNNDSPRNEVPESSIEFENDEERPKKKPRFKLPRRNTAKKTRESNIFLKALDNTKDTSAESVSKEVVSMHNTSKSSNDDSRTNRKLRPTIFKSRKARPTKKSDGNEFDKDLDSDPASEHPSIAHSIVSATTSGQQRSQSASFNKSLSSAQRETFGISKEPVVRLTNVTPNKPVTDSREVSKETENRRSSKSRTVLFPIENQEVSPKSLVKSATHSLKDTTVEKSMNTDLEKSTKDAAIVDPREVTQTRKSISKSLRNSNVGKSNVGAAESQEIIKTPLRSNSTIHKSRITLRNSSKMNVEVEATDLVLDQQSPAVTGITNNVSDLKSGVTETPVSVPSSAEDLGRSDEQAQPTPKSNTQRKTLNKSTATEKSGVVVADKTSSENHTSIQNQEKGQENESDPSNPDQVEEELNKLMQSPEHSGSVNGLLNDLMDSPGGPAQSTMVITGKPVHRVTQFSFRNGSESGKSDSAASSKAAGNKTTAKAPTAQLAPETPIPPVRSDPVQPGHDCVDDDSSWSDDPLIHKSDIDIPQRIANEEAVDRNKIDRFLVSRPAPSDAAGKKKPTSKELLAKLKARSEKLMREEDEESKRRAEKEREAAQQKAIAKAKLKRLEAERKVKKRKQDAQPVHSAYLVNGVRYKPPRLPRPQNWVTDRLYKHLWRKLEPKFGLRARVKSEDFITKLSDTVKLIKKRKKFGNYKSELDRLIRYMAELGIIVTREDFYIFCREYMPYSFREKVIPMNVPGKGLNIPSDPLTLDRPIIRKRVERSDSENNSEDDNCER